MTTFMKGTRIAAAATTAVTTFVFASTVVQAQGAVSNQGFGYPTGELSTRAQGTAGALSEIDSRSPLNPAALMIGPAGQAFAQYDPEVRTVTGPGGSSKTTTARYPNVGFTVPLSKRMVVGMSAATFLDRTWETTSRQIDTIGVDTSTATQRYKSEGGITDLQVALGYQIGQRLRLGIGGHGYTGTNRVSLLRQYSDSLRFRTVSLQTQTGYSGTALSAGFEYDILQKLNLAVSGRWGGSSRLYVGDTVISTGRIPNRYAASLSFEGIPQTLVAFRAAREMWSSMQSMSTQGTRATDANDFSVGLESAGPRTGAHAIVLRVGARRRSLPFAVGTTTIDETSFGGGLGIPLGIPQLGGDRATIDLSVLHNSRTSVGGVSEHALNWSFGLRVQP